MSRHGVNSSDFSTFDHFESYLLSAAKERVICTISPLFLFANGLAFGHGYNQSCAPWTLRYNDSFTTVSMIDQVRDERQLPPFVPLHAQWIVAYAEPRNVSRYDINAVKNDHSSFDVAGAEVRRGGPSAIAPDVMLRWTVVSGLGVSATLVLVVVATRTAYSGCGRAVHTCH